jgi:hypothetical protein
MSRRSTATLVGHTQSDDRDGRNRQSVRRFEVYDLESGTAERVRFSSAVGNDEPRKVREVVAIQHPAVAPHAARLVDDRLARRTLWVVPIGLLFAVPFLIVCFKGRRQATQ